MKKTAKTIMQKIDDFKAASERILGKKNIIFEYLPKDSDKGLFESILVSTRRPIDKSLPAILDDSLKKSGLSRTFEYGGSGINLMTGCQDVSYYRKESKSVAKRSVPKPKKAKATAKASKKKTAKPKKAKSAD